MAAEEMELQVHSHFIFCPYKKLLISSFDAISVRVASTHTNLNRHDTRGKTRPNGLLYKCAYYVSIQKIR
jgi:hypothetical protein